MSSEKTYPDVGGGFVESHPRGDGIDWSEPYPYKGTETTVMPRRDEFEPEAPGVKWFAMPAGARAGRARGPSDAGGELERGELGGSSGASRRSRGGISVEIHVTPPDESEARPRHVCTVHGLWLCNLCPRADGGIA